MRRRSSVGISNSSLTIKKSLKHSKRKTFIHQTSLLDFETLRGNPMRGFFTCFCVGMSLVFILTILSNYKQHGYFVGLHLANVFTKDILSLIKYDVLMILSSFVVVPFQKIFAYGSFSPLAATAVQVSYNYVDFSIHGRPHGFTFGSRGFIVEIGHGFRQDHLFYIVFPYL